MPLYSLDQILGTRAKVRILRALVHLDSPVSGREALRLAAVTSMSGAGRALADLTDMGILHREGAGRTHLYEINRQHVLAAPLTSLFQAEARQFATLRELLREALQTADLAGKVRSVVMFGSAARGEARPDSDLDLLVVADDEAAVGPVRAALLGADAAIREQLGVRASPYVLSRQRTQIRQQEGDPLLAAIRSEGRTVLGDPLDEVIGAW